MTSKRALLFFITTTALAQGPYITEGIRIGEVTERSAKVWLRLSPLSHPIPGKYPDEPRRSPAGMLQDGVDPWKLPGAVPGIIGRARLWLATRPDMKDGKPGEWLQTGAEGDYGVQVEIDDLRPGRTYHVAAEINTKPVKPDASFTTPPGPRQRAPVRFTAVTGLMYRDMDHDDGFEIFAAMAKTPPSFLVFTGDNVYYDNEPPRAVLPDIARYHWQRIYARPRPVELFSKVPQYWMKDDHDTLHDDCWPGSNPDFMLPMTFEEGRKLFLEQVPMSDKTYRTFRWGKGLQIWLLEARDYRSPNTMADSLAKSILGAEQKNWLKKTLGESDADWRVIISPTPWVGPDRPQKADNHSNAAFAAEGKELRAWAAGVSPKNVIVVTGDRHWQYHSVDPATGLNEFATGPASDAHAGGSPGEDKQYHRFHRVKGGYLSVEVTPAGNASRIAFRHHDVTGAVVYEWSPQ